MVCGTMNAEGNLNFWIAPTIYMETKASSRPKLIAPTMLMKIDELVDFRVGCHDVIERKIGYRENLRSVDKLSVAIQRHNGDFVAM